MGGTIIGAFVIGVLSDGPVMLGGVSSFWQMVIKGIVMIAAVVRPIAAADGTAGTTH